MQAVSAAERVTTISASGIADAYKNGVQWFAMIAIGSLTVLVIHFGLVWYRRISHHVARAPQAAGVQLRAGVRRSRDISNEEIDARIAKIISEIPQRRVRQHS